jgi:hypothetical protein
MSGPQFFQTHMGRRFYEHTMPELVEQVARVGDALEALLVVWAKSHLETLKEEKR